MYRLSMSMAWIGMQLVLSRFLDGKVWPRFLRMRPEMRCSPISSSSPAMPIRWRDLPPDVKMLGDHHRKCRDIQGMKDVKILEVFRIEGARHHTGRLSIGQQSAEPIDHDFCITQTFGRSARKVSHHLRTALDDLLGRLRRPIRPPDGSHWRSECSSLNVMCHRLGVVLRCRFRGRLRDRSGRFATELLPCRVGV